MREDKELARELLEMMEELGEPESDAELSDRFTGSVHVDKWWSLRYRLERLVKD